jgi:FMN phosphatase YigB (HAD superfamily)
MSPGVLVSGVARDPCIFELLVRRFAIGPKRAVYIDDVVANAGAARPFGSHAILFTIPTELRTELAELGLLPSQSTIASR